MGGAVEKVWSALGQEFARLGHSVTHISRRHAELSIKEWVNGVDCIRIAGFDTPRSILRLKWLDCVYSLRALRLLPEADILVTNTFFLPIFSRDQTRGKVYVHVARFPKGQMFLYSRAARLQTVSRSVADAIVQESPESASKVRVIPYPIVSKDLLARRVGVDRGKHILFVGRVHPEKGVHLLIRAFCALAGRECHGLEVSDCRSMGNEIWRRRFTLF